MGHKTELKKIFFPQITSLQSCSHVMKKNRVWSFWKFDSLMNLWFFLSMHCHCSVVFTMQKNFSSQKQLKYLLQMVTSFSKLFVKTYSKTTLLLNSKTELCKIHVLFELFSINVDCLKNSRDARWNWNSTFKVCEGWRLLL